VVRPLTKPNDSGADKTDRKAATGSRWPTVAGVAVVVVQAVLIVAVILTPGGADWPVPGWLAAVATAGQVAGAAVLVVAAVNLGRSLTALPNPTGRSTLKTGGLYRWARHPIYSGLIALMAGTAAKSANIVDGVLTAALVLLLAGKARWEERMLRNRYPGYAAYADRTPAFVPGLRRRPPDRD
jgi:protein-S-isoprenylcysteine O-methyltransferase Ste14